MAPLLSILRIITMPRLEQTVSWLFAEVECAILCSLHLDRASCVAAGGPS